MNADATSPVRDPQAQNIRRFSQQYMRTLFPWRMLGYLLGCRRPHITYYTWSPTPRTLTDAFVENVGECVGKDVRSLHYGGLILSASMDASSDRVALVRAKTNCIDIDIKDYADVTQCCSNGVICQACFANFLLPVARVIVWELCAYGFGPVLCVFSGNQGLHCWFACGGDKTACALRVALTADVFRALLRKLDACAVILVPASAQDKQKIVWSEAQAKQLFAKHTYVFCVFDVEPPRVPVQVRAAHEIPDGTFWKASSFVRVDKTGTQDAHNVRVVYSPHQVTGNVALPVDPFNCKSLASVRKSAAELLATCGANVTEKYPVDLLLITREQTNQQASQ